jgi:hypothetical protein
MNFAIFKIKRTIKKAKWLARLQSGGKN